MKFVENNEVYWTSTIDSNVTHRGLPPNVEFEVRKHKGRFMLKSGGIYTSPEGRHVPPFIYPKGISANVAKAMEDECAPPCAVQKQLMERELGLQHRKQSGHYEL